VTLELENVMASVDETKKIVLDICENLYVFENIDINDHLDSDFYETRIIDSLSLSYLRGVLEERLDVELPLELFVVELRTIRSVIEYIADNCDFTKAA